MPSISLPGSDFDFDHSKSEPGEGVDLPQWLDIRVRLSMVVLEPQEMSISLPGYDFDFECRMGGFGEGEIDLVLIALRRAPSISREVVRRRAQAFLMARASADVGIEGRPRGRRGRGVPQHDRRRFPGARRRLVGSKG